jgi:hypothetical protein
MQNHQSVRDEPSDHLTVGMSNRLTLYELLDQVLQDFHAAVGNENGWGWREVSLAVQLHLSSSRLQRWRDSVLDLATDFYDHQSSISNADVANTKVCNFLTLVESDHLHLSGVIRLYLTDLWDVMKAVRIALTDVMNGPGYVSQYGGNYILLTGFRSSLAKSAGEELSVLGQSLGFQLDPLSAFMHSRLRDLQLDVPRSLMIVALSDDHASETVETQISPYTSSISAPVPDEQVHHLPDSSGTRPLRTSSNEEHDDVRRRTVTGQSIADASLHGLDGSGHRDSDFHVLDRTSNSLDYRSVMSLPYTKTSWTPTVGGSLGNWTWDKEERNYYRYKLDTNGHYIPDGSGMVFFTPQREKGTSRSCSDIDRSIHV